MKKQLVNPEIRFETTNHCAYHCKVCPRETMTRDKGIMGMDMYRKLVDDGVSRGLKQVTLTGFGEAFLDKYFLERVEYAKKQELFVSVDTTGYLLNEEKSRRLVELDFDFIRFSIFATDAPTYKVLHKLDKFEKVLTNVDTLLKVRAELNATNPKVGVYFVEQPGNEHQTQEFIDYWVPKVDEVNVWKAHNWINSYELRPKNFARKKTCGRPHSGPLQIRWNGEISACCFDHNNQLITSDVSDGNFDSMFADDRLLKLQAAHATGDMKDYPLCENCDQMFEVPDTLIFTTEKSNTVGTSGNTFVNFVEEAERRINDKV